MLPSPLNSRPGAGRLPQELVDIVIHELHDDRDTLKRCSLVAKNWLPTSSSLLLRRVLWSPCANEIDVCKASSPNEPLTPCKYIPTSQSSFALCLEILASSPRLQCFVREIVFKPPNKKHGIPDGTREALDLETFVNIVDHLPHLESVRLFDVVLKSNASPSSAGTGRALQSLSAFCASVAHLETLFSFIKTFWRVQHLSLIVYGLYPQDRPTDLPASKPVIEVLECKHLHNPGEPPASSSPISFYAGLARTLDLNSLRRLVVDTLHPSTTAIFSAAPALDSLGLSTNSWNVLPVEFERIPPGLASLDVSCALFIHNSKIGPPGANGEWNSAWTTARAATALPIRNIVVKFQVFFFHPAAGTSQEGLYAQYEAMLSKITDWRTATRTLDDFARLERIVVEVYATLLEPESSTPVHVHERYVAAMRDTIAKGLPRRYMDILHVKAAALKLNV